MSSYLTIDNYKKYLIKQTKRKLTFEMFGITYIIDEWKRCWILTGRTPKYGYKTYGYVLEPIPEGFEVFRNKYDQNAFIKHFIRGKDNNGYLYRLTTEDLVRIRRMEISYFDDNKLNDAGPKEERLIRSIRKGRKSLKDFPSLPSLHIAYNNSSEILTPLNKWTNIVKINETLKNLGYEEKLNKAYGYFYFVGGTSDEWKTNKVNVKRLNHYSIDEWIEQRNILAGDANEKFQASDAPRDDSDSSS